MSKANIHHAQLDWDDKGQPLSAEFGDVYFSRENGLAETEHVFLAGNRLAERFAALPEGGHFVIGETGFGTGLNFLCAWQLFCQCAPSTTRLHFISVEKYPLTYADLERALKLWPSLTPEAQALLQQYVGIGPGFQSLVFEQGRIRLTLLVGDVLEQLPQLEAEVDAWFLDGFAPAKNPDMWTPALFSELARLSAPTATLGTFTSAGFVRRGLSEFGFDMRRVPGYGHKREILRGDFKPERAIPKTTPAWFARPALRTQERKALVIGAGLAGCASAASLAQRGWQVTLLERHAAPAQEGSGNPQGVLYLKLSAHGTLLSRLVVSGFGYTRRLLQHIPQGAAWSACGVLQQSIKPAEQARLQAMAEVFPSNLLQFLDEPQASEQAGVPLTTGGLWFPEAGWLHPPTLCQQLLDHPQIQLRCNQSVAQLERHPDGDWQALDAQGQILAKAPIVVVAAATDSLNFPQLAGLPLKRIRGQITRLPATSTSQRLKTVLCAEGYIAPALEGEHTLGASFALHAQDLNLSTEEHQSNLALLEAISPTLHGQFSDLAETADTLDGRAAFRCTAPDYLPLVGPLAEAEPFFSAYASLRKDARLRPTTPCPWLDGIYLNTAHGSRGLITAPLAAELLAAWLEHEPLPLPRAVAEACHPNRFLLRKIIRGT